MPKKILFLSTLLFTATACAQQPIVIDHIKPVAKDDLKSFAFWQNKVGRENCTNDFNVPDERLVQIFDVTDEHKLLQIACEYGAYQDSHRSYLIDNSGNILKPIIFMVPINEESKNLRPSNTVWGSLSLTDNSELELLYLSAGSGACGYRARYEIEALLTASSVMPVTMHADTDCYNGELVPSWPKIEFN